ncbi:uncharacterized protein HMPREF1541_10619 [Cyphellophora europaea CBS 101466]|uniref:Uncharacterized protein n=1 Tax=Cyphellophora europaea (strain CBS 101466) TaxID=1220924 RepID=W2S8U6_CYPE1|nr:uncharacterized protein HMPREF1541_10619 [Cyphellophora europaea CBS 101466]ETN44438.1 hypothetical protein HMPREF1541_10619 [Cyphellophora europaea CBS 101466]
MIDSAHPSISSRNDVERDNNDDDDTPTFQPTTKPHIREKITRCFREARRMIREYEPPLQPRVQGELGGVKVKLLRAREGRRRRGMQTGLTTDDGMMGWGRSGVVGEEDVVEIAGSHFKVFEDGNRDEGAEGEL